MKERVLMFLSCFLLCTGLAMAQGPRVTGVVTSAENGEPIIGASVLVKGTTLGTITGINGDFVINGVPRSATTLVVSYVGMSTQEVTIKPGLIKVELKPVTETLDEVVVTAQGLTRKEKSLGYSTQKVSGEDLTIARQTDLGNAMAGKISGARFYGKSGATFDSGSIVLRGSNDFTSPEGSEPIYVVDGTISNKNSVNMDDVESINVLKGAAATALYGSQGGNGAIIITTKSAKEGKGHLEVSHTISWEKYYNHFDMQKQYGGGSIGLYAEYYDAEYGADYDTSSADFLYGSLFGYQNSDGSYYYDYYSDESWGARFDPNVKMASALYWDSTSSKYGVADPYVSQLDLGDLYRTALGNTTNISFSKAGKDYSSRISFTNSSRDGLQPNSNAIRRYLGVKTSFKPTDWMNVSLDYKYTYRRDHNGASEGYGASRNTVYSYMQWGQTNVNLKDYKDYKRPDGSWRAWNIVEPTDLSANFHDNPYAIYHEVDLFDTYQWNVFTADAEFLLPKNFKAGIRVMGNVRSGENEEKWGEGSINFESAYSLTTSNIRDITVHGRVTWGDRFINNRLTVDAAAFIEQDEYSYRTMTSETADGLAINGYYNLASSNGYVDATNSETHYKTRSIYGTVTLGFDDTYFLDGSLRNDWDSRLSDSNNSFLYGGLSASVMLNQFMKGAKWLNFWKLRASFAQVGSTLSAYNIHRTYSTSKYNAMTALYSSSTQLNENIKPTISTSYEIGTEFRLFDNRLWGDINLYRRDSKNQILSMTVAPQSGYSSRKVNAGLVRNQGVEISLGGTILRNKNFQWDIDANIAKNKNKLVRLNESIKEYMIEGNSFYYYWYLKAIVGKPLGTITTMGRWARNDDGKLIVQKSTSRAWGGGYSPTYDLGTEKEVGSMQPDWTGGFSTSVRYKNFRLAANFDFMIGGKMVSWTNMWSTGSGTNESTARLNNNGVNEREGISKGGGVFVDAVDTDGNAVQCYMNAYYYYHYKAYYDLDEWIYDRSYLKMREVAVSYDVPSTWLSKMGIGISSASISFVANNPWLMYSACPNIDPSESSSNWLEGGQTASTRSFGLTVKLGF